MIRLFSLLSVLFFSSATFCHAQVNYSPAVVAGEYIYVSGQVPIDPNTGQMIEGDIATLTTQAINNMQQVLQAYGSNLNKVVKTVVYLRDIRDYDAMDAAYGAQFFLPNPPARDVVTAANLLYNAQIEISCVAYKKH